MDAQLGNENETIDQVQAGTLDFARINTSALASTADSVGVFTLPYIFTGTEQKYKVLDGEIGKSVSDSLLDYNMIGLEYWEAGSRNFYTAKKPVQSVDDLKGMKLRVQQSDVAIKMVELLEAIRTGYYSEWEFKQNKYSMTKQRVHFTPIWYPDGNYKTYMICFDAWTPDGQLVAQDTFDFEIEGNAYDDWVIVPQKID